MAAIPNHPYALDELDPDSLEQGIHTLVYAYQKTRSTLIAWFVVHGAQALCRHPDYEGSDEERCAWHRTLSQWRWLAQQRHRSGYAEDNPGHVDPTVFDQTVWRGAVTACTGPMVIDP